MAAVFDLKSNVRKGVRVRFPPWPLKGEIMEIVLDTMTINVPSLNIGVLISSNLQREHCPHCDTPDCDLDCDGSLAEFEDVLDHPVETDEERAERLKFNHTMDVIEAMTLAIVVQSRGVIDTIALKEILNPAIKTVLDKIGNQ